MNQQEKGGKVSQSIDMRTGKVNFSLPLFSFSSPGGAQFDLQLKYESSLLPRLYQTWNREWNGGLLGIGWSLNIEDNVFAVVDGTDIYYFMAFKGVLFSLKQETKTDLEIYYTTAPVSNYSVRYDIAQDVFYLFDEFGIKYYFGTDETENGEYNPITGDYTEASKEYEAIRMEISSPSLDNMPANRYADNTICSSVEKDVNWSGWIGPSQRIEQQSQRSICWRLSRIEDAFDNCISFSYCQHISKTTSDENSKEYNVCSYLYRIRLIIGGVETEKAVFLYDPKGPGEYNVDFTLYPRPNGVQTRFQKLYLRKIIYSKQNYVDKAYCFETEMFNEWETVGELCKRQLNNIFIYNNEQEDAISEPGYSFEYYNDSDGVSIGLEGFDNKNKLYSADTGAVYGQLKKIIYPTAKIEEFRYRENNINSVSEEIEESYDNIKKQHEILTPYNYHIFWRLLNNNHVSVVVYTWTILGWRKQELYNEPSSEAEFNAYNYDAQVALFDDAIVFSSMNGTNVYIYKLSLFKAGLWNSKNIISFLGKIYSVSVNKNRMMICTLDTNVFYIYPMIYQNDQYVMVGAAINVTQTVGVTKMVSTACMQHGWVVLTLYEDSYTTIPKGFTGRPLTYYREVIRCFVVRADGTTSKPMDIGYVPYSITKTRFTTAVPPIVASPQEFSMYANIGGQISRVKQIDKMGEVLYWNLETKPRMGFFCRNVTTMDSFIREQKGMDWGATIIYNSEGDSFKLLGESLIREHEYPDDYFHYDDIDKMVVTTSDVASGNGITYNWNITIPERQEKIFEDDGTVEYFYDGIAVTWEKDFSSHNYACLFRDNFFEVFYRQVGSEQNPIFRKIYKYYDQKFEKFISIETGSIDATHIVFNEQDKNILKYLGYAGAALSVILLPLGLTTTFGLFITALSLALMLGTSVVEEMLNNSVRLTMDPNVSFYGNRFFVDGATIWFRENGQERLLSLGKGLQFDSSDRVRGKVIADEQQFGVAYNYIPFYTSAKALYYALMKNGRVAQPKILTSWSEGINGIDHQIKNGIETMMVYKGNMIYEFRNKIYTSYHKLQLFGKDIYVDTIMKIEHPQMKAMFYFSGKYYSIQLLENNMVIPWQLIADGIVGTEFESVDAALFVGWQSNMKFYIFNNCNYEEVLIENGNMTVIARGSIKSWGYPCPYDKIDSATYIGENKCIFTRYDSYTIIDMSSKIVINEGILGDYLLEELSAENTNLQFNYDALVLTRKTENGQDFILKKLVKNSLQGIIRDYVIDTVKTYSSDTSYATTKYVYDTYGATYFDEGQTVGYREVAAVAENQFGGKEDV